MSVNICPKVIALWQPYASLIAMGIKQYETRSWHPGKRIATGETLLIHAAKRKIDIDGMLLIKRLGQYGYGGRDKLDKDDFPFGVIVAEVQFQEALSTNQFVPTSHVEKMCGNYEPNRYAWKLDLVRVFTPPIPTIGRQGIWQLKDEATLASLIMRQGDGKEKDSNGYF